MTETRRPLKDWLVPVVGILCLWPQISAAMALFLGALLALVVGNAFETRTRALTPKSLSLAVIGLGAGMNLLVVGHVGLHGLGATFFSIGGTFLLGAILQKAFGTERNTSILITVGTAICGGSAIAAAAPVLGSKSHETSVALGIVFMLNACALFIFPPIGHAFGLSQDAFGLWGALAIHDTSSVVGATMQYGARALEVGTTVKLARALWIVPVTFGLGLWIRRLEGKSAGTAKPKRPWFILGFLAMAAFFTWMPALQPIASVIETIARRILVLTLFLIGANLSRATLRSVGWRPLLQGVILWILVASISLVSIQAGWIS